MPRVKGGPRRTQRRSKITTFTKGYWGRRKNLFRTARQAMIKALVYAYKHRKAKKREFRQLWIARISAGLYEQNLNYSKFIHLLNQKNIKLNRKALAYLAFKDKEAFDAIVKRVQS